MKHLYQIIRDWFCGIRRCPDCAGILTCVGQPPFEIRICEPCRTQERILEYMDIRLCPGCKENLYRGLYGVVEPQAICDQCQTQVVFTIKDAPRCKSFDAFVKKYENELMDMAKGSPPKLPGLRRSELSDS